MDNYWHEATERVATLRKKVKADDWKEIERIAHLEEFIRIASGNTSERYEDGYQKEFEDLEREAIAAEGSESTTLIEKEAGQVPSNQVEKQEIPGEPIDYFSRDFK